MQFGDTNLCKPASESLSSANCAFLLLQTEQKNIPFNEPVKEGQQLLGSKQNLPGHLVTVLATSSFLAFGNFAQNSSYFLQ
jgi:hypothetical protein